MKKSKKIQIFLLLSFIMIFSPVYVQAMHIMEGFLPPKWAIFWFIVTAPFFIMGLKNLNKIFKDNPNKKMLVALCGAFVFVLSALKIPSVTGSCSHPTGVGLGAVLFGPTVMTVLGVIVLLFQALLLAHGGLTTLGANTFSMAVAGPILAYVVFKGLKKLNFKSSHAIFWAAALGDLFTYIVTAIQLGFAHPDPVGGIMVSIVKFLGIFAITQMPLAIAEGLLTSIVYNLLLDYKKEGVILDENIN